MHTSACPRCRSRRWGPWLLTMGMLVLLVAPTASSAPVVGLNTFANGTVADADDVNANFTVIEAAVNDNDARITALEQQPGPGQGQVIAGQGFRPSAGGTVFGVYGASGTEAFSQILIPRAGTLERFSARADASIDPGASVSVFLRVNGATVATPLTFTAIDGTTMKTDAVNSVSVAAGDLVAFQYTETNGVVITAANLHAAVTLR